MSEFANVTVVREANIYFNGGVVSHTVLFADGTKKTLGVECHHIVDGNKCQHIVDKVL